MVFVDALTKAGRLVEMQTLFWSSPTAIITTTFIAAHLGIAPRTARKYVSELSGSGVLPVMRDGRGWRLVDGARMQIPPVRFHLEEAAAVYLAARLLLAHADEPNPAVGGAIAKLAKVVPAEMRRPFQHLVARAPRRIADPLGETFKAVSYGWALRRLVRVEYAPRSRAEPFTADLRPYLLEPSAVGSALYVIGRVDPPGETRVLKLGRIRSARLLHATFRPADTADLLARLDRAWGVWLTHDEPTEVHLRFTSEVCRRLRETRWHPSQRLAPQPDGAIDMHITVASTVEVLPWVLGWGSHVEVLAPAALRREVTNELRLACQRYSG